MCIRDRVQDVKLYVLQQLVHEDDNGSFVWLADQSDGKALKTAISIGTVSSSGLVEVTSGLTVSSRIISGGRESLEHDDRIQVVSEDTSLEMHVVPGSSESNPTNQLPEENNR